MSLHIHRGERADVLSDALAGVLADPLADPFAAEVVTVPSKGIQRWLTQRLSDRLGCTETPRSADGVAANIRFVSPAALTAEVLATASGVPQDEDPWAPEAMVWPLLRAIAAAATEPWGGVLAGVGGVDGAESGGRYRTAARIAARFENYGTQRPELLREWAHGAHTDGTGAPLPKDLHWQPKLWRWVRADIGTPSPAERLPAACAALRADPKSVALPSRLSVFAPTRLSADQLAVLSALAEHRAVHLWLTHPSPVWWARKLRESAHAEPIHPLLVGCAREIRELAIQLPTAATDQWYPPETTQSDQARHSLLARLHAGIAQDQWPTTVEELAVDDSVQLHSCPGPVRQVEVLREVLAGLFARDRSLEPRDVLVMCPDIDTFAPLIRSGFAESAAGPEEPIAPATHPAHLLRVRLADRGRTATNPVLAVLSALLELADARVGITQVLGLAAMEPVRRRCLFTEDDLDRLRGWVERSGARWGIGQRQRQAFGLGDFAQNTLNNAVDRILLGVTAGETSTDWLDLALPLAELDSNDIDLAGRFAEFVDRLAAVLRDFHPVRPAREWYEVLLRGLDLLTEVPPSAAWTDVEARRDLAAALDHAESSPLARADIQAVLAHRLAAQRPRSNFRTGELTVCGLTPLRAVPHQVVVLLGMDDAVFPHAHPHDGDDVLARRRCTGERDPRLEDRQLFLEAVRSAQQRLVVLYTGTHPVTGAPQTPAILVTELLDVLRAAVGEPGVRAITTHHPIQPFDPGNFRAQAPRSFDTGALAGARAVSGPRRCRPSFLPAPLPPPEPADVAVSELIAFIQHPVRAFLWQRLGLRIPDFTEELSDRLPVELDGLTKWDLGERLLAAQLTGADPADLRAAEWRRGTLPPFGLGAAVLADVQGAVDPLVRLASPDYQHPARSVDVVADLGQGRQVTGTVPSVRGDILVHTTYSRLAPKHRLAAWVALLTLMVSHPERPWRAVLIGRGRFRRPAWRCELAPPPPAEALTRLRDLVALRDSGLTTPLPVATATTAAYAERRYRGSTVAEARAAAETEFLGGPYGPTPYGEHADRHLRYLWGSSPRLTHLLAEPPADPNRGEPSQFGLVARRLWTPLLQAEEQGQA